MLERSLSHVEFEIQQLDRLFREYADLLSKARQGTPDLVEMTAVASVLHSFYTGLENIFKCIAEDVDKTVPTGDRWHRRLLDQMMTNSDAREAVLSTATAQRLVEYLGFRHYYRHGYSFFLDWEKLRELVVPLDEAWEATRGELSRFVEWLHLELEGDPSD